MYSNELALDAYVDSHRKQIVEELGQFCAQPSVAARGDGINAMANLVAVALQKRGFQVNLVRTQGNPIVLAESESPNRKSLLFYNHYDVQPEDPVDQWLTPPFEPTIKDGSMFARGVMDDKGHIVCRLAAIDAVQAVYGELPCAIKWVIEGEEEVSSPNLAPFVQEHQDRLHADGCLWEFGDVDYDGVSVNYLGFRGILYVQFTVKTADRDAHSGIGGTILPNAAWRLTWALASLKNVREEILIPGFYTDVKRPTPEDLALLAQLPPATARLREVFGVSRFLNDIEDGVQFQRAAIFNSSCTICGLTAGYQGHGSKTVIPAQAAAKVDFRLVPDQDPDDVFMKLRHHLDAAGFDDIEITCLGKEKPARTPIHNSFVQMVAQAARDVYGSPQRLIPMSGGSGPAHLFVDTLGVPVATVGIGNPNSNIHSPNENIRLEDLFRGIRHTARVITRIHQFTA